MSERLTVYVSGAAWRAACDPRVSNVPREEGWGSDLVGAVKAGRGNRYLYETTPERARLIADHLQDLHEGLAYAPDPASKNDSRACAAAAQSIYTALDEA